MMGIRTAFNPMSCQLEKCPFEQNETIFQSSTPGTYHKDIVDGVYEIWACGGGGGGTMGSIGGGRDGCQGAALIGVIYLTQRTLNITVGAGGISKGGAGSATTIANLFTCGGGSDSGGGGILSLYVGFLSTQLAINGAKNNTASPLGNGYNYGAGGKYGKSGKYNPTAGGNGFVLVKYLRPKP